MSLADLPITNRDRAADDMALLRQYVDEESQDAFAGLVDRHASWIHASARRALRTRDLADDATQTVFVILARKAPTIAPNVRVSGWLYHTTRFVISDLRKRATRHRRRHDAIMQAALERKNNDTVRNTRRLDHVRDTIGEALARLPEHERNAIAMHFFDGMTFRQMGEVLGLSREGAKKRVARAMARLRSGFAVKGAAIAALATIGAAIRGLFAPAAVKAAISTIGHPTISIGKAGKIVGSGLKLLVNEITQNAARITALRVAGGAAVVGTAVLCGTKIHSSHHANPPGQQGALQSPMTSETASRATSFASHNSTGVVANVDRVRNIEAAQGGVRQLATIAQPAPSVRGTQSAPRTIGAGNAVAFAQFEDPFKRPSVYVRSDNASAKVSTRVDDFRASGNGGGGDGGHGSGDGTVRAPLDHPDKPIVIDPKLVDPPPLADAGATPAPANDLQKPAGEVNRRVRRGSGESPVASSNTPSGTIFKNLGLDHAPAGGTKLPGQHGDSAAPTIEPPTPTSDGGELRPTLRLPPKHDQANQPTEPASPTSPTPSDQAPSDDGHHNWGHQPPQNPNHAGDGGDGGNGPTTPADPVEAPIDPSHQGTGNPVGAPAPTAPPTSPVDAPPVTGGDDGSWQPAAPAKPLPGDGSYDLLEHGVPSPTPITDEMLPPSMPGDGASFDLPATSGLPLDVPVDVSAVTLSAAPDAQPSLSTLPEPSSALVALAAGAFGFARRRRTNLR
jgi:RNA polymerase sigma factor (sigma-70 family)